MWFAQLAKRDQLCRRAARLRRELIGTRFARGIVGERQAIARCVRRRSLGSACIDHVAELVLERVAIIERREDDLNAARQAADPMMVERRHVMYASGRKVDAVRGLESMPHVVGDVATRRARDDLVEAAELLAVLVVADIALAARGVLLAHRLVAHTDYKRKWPVNPATDSFGHSIRPPVATLA
ncbi:MAG TPA: hypothetical protein VGL61_17605 [Kofleriaceae bacterium]